MHLPYSCICSAELEVTVNFLIEIDKLVQLLESPIFTCTHHSDTDVILASSIYLLLPALRLQLLEPEQHTDLFKALYGVLMLLPQSAAYETLKSRLNAISSLGVLHLLQKSSTYEISLALSLSVSQKAHTLTVRQ